MTTPQSSKEKGLERAGINAAAGAGVGEPTASAAILRAETGRAAKRAAKRLKETPQSYTKMIHSHFQSPQYAKLTPRAVKLLVDLMAQYRGTNNGDLTTAWSVMRERGWSSKSLLYAAQDELEARGWLVRMRQGILERGKHTATLWALAFFPVNDCGKDKRDSNAPRPDTMPLHLWRMPEFDTPAKASGRRFRKKVLVRVPGLVRPDTRASASPFTPILARYSDRKAA